MDTRYTGRLYGCVARTLTHQNLRIVRTPGLSIHTIANRGEVWRFQEIATTLRKFQGRSDRLKILSLIPRLVLREGESIRIQLYHGHL